MPRIRVLDPQTVNEIAAGEVIERPASVVKELIENALDAGAKRIEVRTEQGGKRRIEVTDDGFGMGRDDVLLAVKQHATSKLFEIDDLSQLSTFGFRGEALSSIASVSRMTIRTRSVDDEEGTELVTEFGADPEVYPVGAPVGTRIIIENLFGNVPARRKHLSSDRTEKTHITEVVVRYAVVCPETAFDLYSDGEIVKSFRGPDHSSRVSELIGARAASRLVDIDAVSGDMRISGALTRMDVTRSSTSSIFLYVNRRPVRSPYILSAITDGYGTRLMRGKYPMGYLMIAVPPNNLDVNIHPTKREVRLAEPDRVRESVIRAVDDAFSDKASTLELGNLMDYMSVGNSVEGIETRGDRDAVQTQIVPEAAEGRDDAPLHPLFQLFDTYIVAMSGNASEIILIDQHAAAERVVYESILTSIDDERSRSQDLLTPLLIDLSSAERGVLEENREQIKTIGFEIEEFGADTLRLTKIPTVLGQAQGESALREVIDELSRVGRRRPLGEDLIWKVACHGSIRAGQSLTLSEMRRLIVDLFRTSNPYSCEHGRPTMISLKIDDLERLFKR